MEAAARSIGNLASNNLPLEPHHLAVSASDQYQLRPNDPGLEEDVIRPLQYMTYLHDIDRGILFTRANFDILKDPEPAVSRNATSPLPRSDSSKPKTKLSLKDYKNRAKEGTPTADGPSPPKSSALLPPVPEIKVTSKDDSDRDTKRTSATKQQDPVVAKSMERRHEGERPRPNLPPKPEMRRPRSPSPDRRKRPSDLDEDSPAKRIKHEKSLSSANGSRLPSRHNTPIRSEKQSGHSRNPSRDLKPLAPPTANGRPALTNSSSRTASPKPTGQVNGSSQKSLGSSSQHSPTKDKDKREPGSAPRSQTSSVPPLLSPTLPLNSDEYKRSKAMAEKSSDRHLAQAKSQPRKGDRDEHSSHHSKSDSQQSVKKTRSVLPPLLSPTLPPIVMEALANYTGPTYVLDDTHPRSKKSTPSKDSSLKPGQKGESGRLSKREDTIHVDSKGADEMDKEEPSSLTVKLKYGKKNAKRVSRLLALPPAKKRPKDPMEHVRKEEPPVVKEDRSGRDRSVSLDPASISSARKRPRTAADEPTALKRPRMSEIGQPSTPSKQGTAMQRVASSSSQAGTPSASTGLTPAAPTSSDRRQTSVDPEKVNWLKRRNGEFTSLGTKLKHNRDHIMKPRSGDQSNHVSSRDRNSAMADGVQSTLAYLIAFKAGDECRDAERKQRDPTQWKSLQPLLRMYRADCQPNQSAHALMLRLHAIALGYQIRAVISIGPDTPANARELFHATKDQDAAWRSAEEARKRVGVSDGHDSSDGAGSVGRLLLELGPWSTPEEAVAISLDILRQAVRLDKFVPERRLAEISRPQSNGLRS